MIPEHVREAYGLVGPACRLPGGSQDAYRVGDVVVKRLVAMSFENPHSLALAPWLAEQIAGVTEAGFRLARPVAARDGAWVVLHNKDKEGHRSRIDIRELNGE